MSGPVEDTDLLMRWMAELRAPAPDPAIVAALESVAEREGFHLPHAYYALTAARSFNPDLHPRGRDGRFIEKFGLVRLFGVTGRGKGGQSVDLNGRRGRVESIEPDPKSPGRPNVKVALLDDKGIPRASIVVKPDKIEQAPEKARLDKPLSKDFLPPPEKAEAPKVNFDTAKPGDRAAPSAPPPETPEQREARKARERARGTADEDLIADPNDPVAWQNAVAAEKANREQRRAADNAKRQALINSINEQAAALSKDDPQARAEGLDDILAKLRFSIIDTDKVHDHIYPPGESGRWTAERAGQHEAMWDELIAQVEASAIPKDRDALVLGGLPGAGKSFTLRPGQKASGFGVTAWEPGTPMPDGATHVSLNPDIVKEMLIARGMLPQGISNDLKPMEQVTFLHEESSYVAKLFSTRLGDLGYNVVLDNTMDSEGGMLKRMTPLARQGYKFRGLFVDIPVDESKASAKQRYLDAALTDIGGRFVPSSVQGNRASSKGNLSKNRDAMDGLVAQDWFTEWMIVDNTGISTRQPRGEVVGQGTGAGSAADRYLPGADASNPKAGPRTPVPPEPAPTIDVNAPIP